MQLTPEGAVTPGTFSALIVTANTRSGLLRTLARIKLGRSTAGLAVASTGLTRLSLRSADLVAGFGDGESLGLKYRTVVELDRGSLNVILPNGRGDFGAFPWQVRRAV